MVIVLVGLEIANRIRMVMEKRLKSALVLGSIAIGIFVVSCAEIDAIQSPSQSQLCMLGVQGHNVVAEFTNQACNSETATLAGITNLYWSPVGGITSGSEDTEVCELSDGSSTLIIWDSGAQLYGGMICSSYEQSDWEPK
jgi:hypothetical protein